MNNNAKRERVKAIVMEQDGIWKEIERLTGRVQSLDTDLDHLLATAPATARAGKPVPPKRATAPKPAAPAKSVPATAKPLKRKAQSAKKKASQKTVAAPAAAPVAGPKEVEKPASRAATAKPKKAAQEAPTIKERMIGALRGHPNGVDVAVLAKLIYGSDDAAMKLRSEQYLYNLLRKKLVTHKGPTWSLVPAHTAA